MYIAINTPGHIKNVVDGLNTADKNYLKGEMELMNLSSPRCHLRSHSLV